MSYLQIWLIVWFIYLLVSPKACKFLSLDKVINAFAHPSRFRWVELQLELFISEEYPILIPQEFEDRLSQLERHSGVLDKLTKAYNDIWERNLKNQGKYAERLAIKALKWVLCSTTPFGSMMLHTAVMMDEDMSLAKTVTAPVILMLCSNFVIEEEGGIIQLAHLSVREFLEEKSINGCHEFSATEAYAQVAETCLKFWGFNEVQLQNVEEATRFSQVLERLYVENFSKGHSGGKEEQQEIEGVKRLLTRTLYVEEFFDDVNCFSDRSVSSGTAKFTELLQIDHETSIRNCKILLFALYCSFYWPDHCVAAKTARQDKSTKLHKCFWWFFRTPGGFDIYQQWAVGDQGLPGPIREISVYKEDDLLKPSRFLTICYYQFDELLPDLMEENWLMEHNDYANMNGLHLATERKNHDIVRFLIAHGADVNASNKIGFTALHFAAQNGDTEAIRLLCRIDGRETPGKVRDISLTAVEGPEKPSIDINARNDQNEAPLRFAAGLGHTAAVSQLMKVKGIDLNALDNHNRTVLHIVASQGHVVVASLLLGSAGVDINAIDKSKQTPLHLAIEHGKADMVHRLLQFEGIDFNAKDEDGNTPLLLAAIKGDKSIIDHLLKANGIDVLARNNDGKTFLQFVKGEGYGDIFLKVLNIDSKVMSTMGKRGRSLLHLAAESGDAKIVRHLLETYHLDINNKDDEGNTPLHLAATRKTGSVDVIKALIVADGIDINAKGLYGRTALHWAIALRNHELFNFLLGLDGIDVNAKDSRDETLLHEAATSGFGESKDLVIALLGTRGIDKDARNKTGWTAADVATRGLMCAREIGNTMREKRCIDVLNLLSPAGPK
jgi:ankyrin repeat protein